MPEKSITLFAVSPIKVNGKRVYQDTFEVDTQAEADALIKSGAATMPDDGVADALDTAEQAEAERLAAEKAEAEKKAADEKAAADKAEAEKKAADEKPEADKTATTKKADLKLVDKKPKA